MKNLRKQSQDRRTNFRNELNRRAAGDNRSTIKFRRLVLLRCARVTNVGEIRGSRRKKEREKQKYNATPVRGGNILSVVAAAVFEGGEETFPPARFLQTRPCVPEKKEESNEQPLICREEIKCSQTQLSERIRQARVSRTAATKPSFPRTLYNRARVCLAVETARHHLPD